MVSNMLKVTAAAAVLQLVIAAAVSAPAGVAVYSTTDSDGHQTHQVVNLSDKESSALLAQQQHLLAEHQNQILQQQNQIAQQNSQIASLIFGNIFGADMQVPNGTNVAVYASSDKDGVYQTVVPFTAPQIQFGTFFSPWFLPINFGLLPLPAIAYLQANQAANQAAIAQRFGGRIARIART